MVTNLGIGALVVQSGLVYLFHIPDTPQVLVAIVLVMMVVATIGVVAGVEKGIARLSNLNVRLLCGLLLFVLVTGPTLHLFDGLIQNTGDYLGAFVRKSFDMYLNDPKGREWMGSWTLFYWAWWIAWAPFVGLFVARISRGRTIREVVMGVLLIPLGFTTAWLSIFGNTAIDLSSTMAGDPGRRGPARCGDDAVQAAGIPARGAVRGRCCGGDWFRAVPDPGRFGHADDRQPVHPSC